MYKNPYFDQDILGFFLVLLQRIYALITAKEVSPLATDETQMIVLCCISTSSALIGTFLVLRQMTMLANAISHTILLGIVLVMLLSMFLPETFSQGSQNIGMFLCAATILGLVTAFLTQTLTSFLGLQADASIGVVFHTLFALGIILVTLFTRNAHIGAESIMGNADALHTQDIYLAAVILGINIVLTVAFFKELTLTTFDPQLAQALGISATLFNYLLMLQTSFTSIGAFRAVGVIMLLAFLTGPPLIARLFTHKLSTCLWLSIFVGIAVSILGVALSRHVLTVMSIPLSTSGVVVCLIAFSFFLALLFAPKQGLLVKIRRLKLRPKT